MNHLGWLAVLEIEMKLVIELRMVIRNGNSARTSQV